MLDIDGLLLGAVLALAALAAIVEYRQRNGWAPILLLFAIGLAFLGHWLHTLGALQ